MSTRTAIYSPISLHGRRIVLRTMTEQDYDGWYEVRTRCRDWLLKWEPRSAHSSHLADDQRSFVSRCAIRERERQLGTGFGFGIFQDGRFLGEITLSSIQRGPLQSAFVGYWIDEAVAGQGLMPEAVVVLLQYAFESLKLHRIEVNIIPRNAAVAPRRREARHPLRGHRRALPRDRRRLGGPRALRHHRRGVGRPGTGVGRRLAVAASRLSAFRD